jgi:hypothetical protein
MIYFATHSEIFLEKLRRIIKKLIPFLPFYFHTTVTLVKLHVRNKVKRMVPEINAIWQLSLL